MLAPAVPGRHTSGLRALGFASPWHAAFDALAEFEPDLIRERTQSGLKTARKRGKLGGRPPVLASTDIKKLKKHYKKGELSVIEICKLFSISKPTMYSYLHNDH